MRLAYNLPNQFDAAVVKRLQADMRRLTKIYQSVPTETRYDPETLKHVYEGDKQWEEAQRLFINFHHNLEEWVYKVVIQHAKSDDDAGGQQDLRGKAWDFLVNISTSTLFPRTWDGRNTETVNYIKDPKELEKKRPGYVRRYQAKFREMIEALEFVLELAGGTVSRAPAREIINVGGVNVVFHSGDRAKRDDGSSEEFLKDMGRQVRLIASAGLKQATDGLTIHLRFEEKPGLVAGEYQVVGDEVTIYALGMSAGTGHTTFIHECGHRFWYRILSNQARAHWTDVIGSQQTVIEAADIEAFMDQIWDPDLQRSERLSKAQEARVGPELAAKYRYLAHHTPAYTHERDGVRDHHLKFNVGERVTIEHITDYGATNPVEAFAEAFQLYVRKGPRGLGPWTRSFFERIVKGGKTASAARVLARFNDR